MRVLLLHNRYRAAGGEERAVADIAALLSRRGHEVRLLERSSAGAARGEAARGLLRGGIDEREVAHAVRELGAEVVHAHNLHPLLGWRALAAARAQGARTVLHLHNFRLFCAIAIAYRDGQPCFRCRRGRTLPGLRLRCRGSLPEAAVYAAGLRRQQPHLFDHADCFLAVSEATAQRLFQLGLPREHTEVLHNFIAASATRSPRAERARHVLAAGRLAEEKGFDTAIAAARAAGAPLVIAGEGPDEARLRELAVGADVRFPGRVSAETLRELRAHAAAVLVPSRWEEPCPYAVLDALAEGVPVLASDRGGLPELVGHDRALPATDSRAWSRALRELWSDPALRRRRGEDALARAARVADEERFYTRLMRAYGARAHGEAPSQI